MRRWRKSVRRWWSGVQSWALRGQRRRKRTANVCMLHMGRAGSTVLAGMLRKHADVDWAGEHLGFARKGRRARRLETVDDAFHSVEQRAYEHGTARFGLELKPNQARNARGESYLTDLLDRMAANGFTHFVLLERRNYLRRSISKAQLLTTGVRHAQQERRGPARIRLDVGAVRLWEETVPLLTAFAELDAHYDLLRAWLQRQSGAQTLELSYEEHIKLDPRSAYRRMCEFLGISPSEDAAPKLRRTNPHPVRDVLENFDEVAAQLADTKYAWMLSS